MNLLILFLLCIVIVGAIVLLINRKTSSSSCCGNNVPPVKAIRPAQVPGKDAKIIVIPIGGMTCANCAVRVQNALNAIPGVSARVSIETRTARVRCSPEISALQLKEAVREAGYCVLDL